MKSANRSLDRREWLCGAASLVLACNTADAAPARFIETVAGKIPAANLGVTLTHEHVLVDFVGADKATPSRYKAEEVFQIALPKLRELYEAGGRTLVECTPAFLGRDPLLLKRLSHASKIQILTNTGLYGAAEDRYIPKYAWQETSEQLANRWIAEAKGGLDGTGIRPAFQKIGVDSGPLSTIDSRLIEAAMICYKETGLRFHVHTGNDKAALSIVELLRKRNCALDAYVWVHAQSGKDLAVHVELAKAGVWISWDGVSAGSLERSFEAVKTLSDKGLAHKLLLSHDSGWYHVGEPNGGHFGGYTYLLKSFVPELKKRGFSEPQVQGLLVENPSQVLGR
jgi:predicted metal-dependent phosphotriesterase family hydrolase